MPANPLPNAAAAPSHLQQIITALTEGVILVQPDGVLCWADETALVLHGAGTLADLGGTAEGYAKRFRLSYIGGKPLKLEQYPLQRLLAGAVIDRATFEVTRQADNRHWVHEVRTRILVGQDGRPDCLVLILDDETERFNAEQRFERTFAANPAPAIIARLSDSRYVKVNRGFLQLTGYRQADLIGRSMHQIDVLRGAEKRDLAVARLHAGEPIPQMEGCLQTADGGEKTVLLGGQPLEIGDDACMLFTFADLHPREMAHRAMRQSEERFSKAFNLAPVPMAILALEGLCILDVNDAFTAVSGWRREEIVGRSEPAIAMWGDPESRAQLEHRIRQGGEVRGIDVRFRFKQGEEGDFLLSADTVDLGGERCVLTVMLDITERKRTQAELLQAVEATMQDASWIGHRIVEKFNTITRTGGPAATTAPRPELSRMPARAREVLVLLAAGASDAEVAERLGITRNTLRRHVTAIYDTVGIRRRGELVAWARDRGLSGTGKSKP